MSGPDVRLVEVTRANHAAVMRLAVAPEQKTFEADNASSLAQAYVYGERAWPRAIYAGDEPVGFLMLDLVPPDEAYLQKGQREYWLWRLMIDQNHQRKGYGQSAVRAVAAHVQALPQAKRLLLSYVPGEGCPEPFYRGMGLEPTGHVEDGEVVMSLNFPGFA